MEDSEIMLRMLLMTLSGDKPWNIGRRVGRHATGTATPVSTRDQKMPRLSRPSSSVVGRPNNLGWERTCNVSKSSRGSEKSRTRCAKCLRKKYHAEDARSDGPVTFSSMTMTQSNLMSVCLHRAEKQHSRDGKSPLD